MNRRFLGLCKQFEKLDCKSRSHFLNMVIYYYLHQIFSLKWCTHNSTIKSRIEVDVYCY